MNKCAMTDVKQALDVLALRYRMPVRCIVDSCPQLRNLVNEENHELTKGLSMQKIEVIVVPAGHQFCNPVERSIQEVKKIFRNLNERASSSLFNQPNNFMDLLYKIALIENIMSLRLMLSNSSDQHSSIITPRLLYHPFMTSEAVTSSAVDLFHHIFTEVLNNNHLTRSGLRQAIVCYLQSSALRFSAKREHGTKMYQKWRSIHCMISTQLPCSCSFQAPLQGENFVITDWCSFIKIYCRDLTYSFSTLNVVWTWEMKRTIK